MLRGWPPPMRVGGASPVTTKFGLLQRGIEAWGAVVSIRLVAVRLLLGLSLCDPGLAMVEVVPGSGVMLGAYRRGPGGSMSGLPLDRALRKGR